MDLELRDCVWNCCGNTAERSQYRAHLFWKGTLKLFVSNDKSCSIGIFYLGVLFFILLISPSVIKIFCSVHLAPNLPSPLSQSKTFRRRKQQLRQSWPSFLDSCMLTAIPGVCKHLPLATELIIPCAASSQKWSNVLQLQTWKASHNGVCTLETFQ